MMDRQTDGWTNRRTDHPGKNNMSPNPKGGRHNEKKTTSNCNELLRFTNVVVVVVVLVVVVCSALTLLSTIFQSYHDGVWLRQGAQCALS